MKTLAAIVLAMVLGAQPSYAAFVSEDGGTAVLDTTTGLTWLTLSDTTGLTASQINSGVGGWNTSYQYASLAQIQTLFADAGLTDSLNYSTGPTEIANAASFNAIFNRSNTTCAAGPGGQFACGFTQFANGSDDLINVGTNGSSGYSYIFENYATNSNFPNTAYGSLMVSRTAPVPLPASAWLLLSAVIGVGASLHRRRTT
jgi:hypothetical protein